MKIRSKEKNQKAWGGGGEVTLGRGEEIVPHFVGREDAGTHRVCLIPPPEATKKKGVEVRLAYPLPQDASMRLFDDCQVLRSACADRISLQNFFFSFLFLIFFFFKAETSIFLVESMQLYRGILLN